MPLKQFKFDPTVEDHDRFIALFNSRFGTSYSTLNDITNQYPNAFSGEYPRNSWVSLNSAIEGRSWWYFDRVDISDLLSKFKYIYIYEEVVHFHGGLPHNENEVIEWLEETVGLTMSAHEIYTSSRGSGGPFFQYNFIVKPESMTMTGSKQMYVRNKWKNHFDEFLFIFELPDINSL